MIPSPIAPMSIARSLRIGVASKGAQYALLERGIAALGTLVRQFVVVEIVFVLVFLILVVLGAGERVDLLLAAMYEPIEALANARGQSGETAHALCDHDADHESRKRAECDARSDAADGWFIIVQTNPLHNQPCGGGTIVRITWQ